MKAAKARRDVAEALGYVYGMLPDKIRENRKREIAGTRIPSHGAIFGFADPEFD